MIQNLERLAKNLVDTNDENSFDQILEEINSVCSTLTNEMENHIDETQQQPSKRQKTTNSTNVGLDDDDTIASKRKKSLSLLKKNIS